MPPIATPTCLVLYQDNTQNVLVNGLQDQSGNFLNAANLTATLLDSNRSPITQLENIAFVYVAATNGNYNATIPVPFNPPVGSEYTMVIDGSQGAATVHMEILTQVQVRRM